MKLLFIKSLFIPKNSFVDVNIDSITKFITYFKTVNKKFTNIFIKIVGWIGEIDVVEKNRFFCFIENQKKELVLSNISLSTDYWRLNYGKCYIFQNISSTCFDNLTDDQKSNHNSNYCESSSIDSFDYVLYADHDISPIDDILKDRFIVGSFLKNDIKNTHNVIGMMSFSQEPDNRHNETIFVNNIEFNGRKYYYHNDNIRIATGCFITTPSTLSILSKVTLSIDNELEKDGVYGEEDIAIGELLNTNQIYNVVSSLRVNHPFCADAQYNQWKERKLLRCALCIKTFPPTHKNFPAHTQKLSIDIT